MTQTPVTASLSESTMISELVTRLAHQYAALPPDQVSTAVRRAHAQFERSPIRDFIPLLVERRARNELSQQETPG